MNSNNSPPSSGNILIIDDIPDNLRFLSELLTKAGYTVRKVINGEMGIESAVLEPPDLILLDIKMPGINGYQVCDRLKASNRTHQIPVIFLSALDEEAEKVMAFQAGGVDYILKPFQVVEVLARIETHLRMSRLQQQLQQKNAQLEQEIEQKKAAEAALKFLDQGLELRIKERTSEIQKENQKLLRLQTELQKVLTQEQQRSNLKSQWLDTITQTFHTPLLTITSTLERLKEKSDYSNESAHQIQAISNDIRSMRQLLQDMSLLRNAEAQKLSFHPIALDLTEFCRSLTNQWQPTISPKYNILFVHFGKPPSTIMLDENLMQSICNHLLSNAIRYSPKGGSILFELVYEPAQVLIRVRDEGIGIPLEEQERIFDRFYRGKNADQITGTSAGLGLTVVKQAVAQHGGTITVSSEVNRGSTFTVSLPIQKFLYP